MCIIGLYEICEFHNNFKLIRIILLLVIVIALNPLSETIQNMVTPIRITSVNTKTIVKYKPRLHGPVYSASVSGHARTGISSALFYSVRVPVVAT